MQVTNLTGRPTKGASPGWCRRADLGVYISVCTDSMAADTTTVRVRRPDSERLHTLAKARQSAVIDVVHAAIDALERQEFLRGLNGDYQHLHNDPEQWEGYLAERHEWGPLA